MNRDRLIADAAARVVDLAPDYVAPLPRTITALGKDALGNLQVRRVGDARSGTDHGPRGSDRARARVRPRRRRRTAASA